MAGIIRTSEFDALFLDLPRSLDDVVRALAEGAQYEPFLERIRELDLVPEPLSSWEYEVEPILLAVRGILNREPEPEVRCYRQTEFVQLSARLAEDVAKLVLRASVTGKVDIDEWRAIITELLRSGVDALDEETEYVSKRSIGKETSICIAGMNARALRDRLSECNLNASLTYLLLPYHFSPIEVLTRTVERELEDPTADGERILQIVKCHLGFVREYVLTSRTYDEAYLRWVRDVAPWMRSRTSPLDALAR